MTTSEPKRSRAQVVRGWFREESFWRDITTRSVSGLIVLGIGALAAALLGVIDGLVVVRVGIIIAAIVVSFAVFVWFANRVLTPLLEAREERRRKRRVSWPLTLAAYALVVVGLGVVAGFSSGVVVLMQAWAES